MSRVKIITFNVQDRCFALPSINVKEIIDNDEKVKPLSFGGEAIKGVIDYEGNLLSVLNTPRLLEIVSLGDEPLVLICRDGRKGLMAGLTISSVTGMEFIDTSEVKPSKDGKTTYISGFIREEEDNHRAHVTALLNFPELAEYASKKIKKID